MSDDERREHAIEACRRAISRWVATDGKEGGRSLRDALHALSACRGMSRNLREKPGPKRRKRAA